MLGLFSSNKQFDESKRLYILKWALQRLTQSLQECHPDNRERMGNIVYFIKSTTKGFTTLLPESFAAPIKEIIDHLALVL